LSVGGQEKEVRIGESNGVRSLSQGTVFSPPFPFSSSFGGQRRKIENGPRSDCGLFVRHFDYLLIPFPLSARHVWGDFDAKFICPSSTPSLFLSFFPLFSTRIKTSALIQGLRRQIPSATPSPFPPSPSPYNFRRARAAVYLAPVRMHGPVLSSLSPPFPPFSSDLPARRPEKRRSAPAPRAPGRRTGVPPRLFFFFSPDRRNADARERAPFLSLHPAVSLPLFSLPLFLAASRRVLKEGPRQLSAPIRTLPPPFFRHAGWRTIKR